MTLTRCYIGIGSNLDEPVSNVRSALAALSSHPSMTLTNQSALYSSKPHGPKNQPDYVNAVAEISTQLGAPDLLHALFAIEKSHGRERHPDQHWGPRTLDLDLLLYGDSIIDEPDLKVPHPYLCERSFVVYPLAELSPALILPTGVSLQSCKEQLAGDDLFVMSAES
ncbi:MAG: 2-amino-4-hydroxy-6-hydroxymethyldihydropteridine diphosphokinase [Thiolinea sp.]